MRPTMILLSRHGETTWNRQGNRYCGLTDIDLSDVGRRQTRLLDQALADQPLAAVYASPLSRAQITAAPAASRHRLPVQVEPRLIETNFGEFEGLTPEQLQQSHPVQFAAWRADPEQIPPPGGETATAAALRSVAALAQIAQRHAGQTVLVVAHNTINRLVLCHLLGAPLRSYRLLLQENCCINALEWGDEQVRVVSVNETAHLK